MAQCIQHFTKPGTNFIVAIKLVTHCYSPSQSRSCAALPGPGIAWPELPRRSYPGSLPLVRAAFSLILAARSLSAGQPGAAAQRGAACCVQIFALPAWPGFDSHLQSVRTREIQSLEADSGSDP